MFYLEMARQHEYCRIDYLERAKTDLTLRDQNIYLAFKNGYRQKEIANHTGLSESTIKHIIAQQKKENEK